MSYREIEIYQGQIDLMPIEHNLQSCTTPGQYELLRINTYWSQTDPPANWAQVYRALLDQDSRSYWEINTYPGRQTPTNEAQVYRALLHQDNMTY